MLHDLCDTTIYDLSSQYFLSNKDLKKNRAVMTRDKLADLNENVEVYVCTIELSEDLIKNYDIVILTDSSLEEQIYLNNYCRNNNIYFISAITRGLIGKIFCDFGDKFKIEDIDGKEINKSYINYIKDGIIVCSEYTEHGIVKNGKIKIYDVQNINNNKIFNVKAINKTTLKVLENINESVNIGYLIVIKEEKIINFKSLEESIKNPIFNNNEEDNKSIFNTLIALDNFFEKNGRLPEPWNKRDGNDLYNITKNFYENVDINIVKNISYTSKGDLCAIQSIIGSLVSNEVLKSCTKKFIPINQWFIYNALDCLKKEILEESFKNISKKYERYISQIFIFGENFQDEINNHVNLISGCGSIGSEFIKNYTMIGLGNIILTDDKNIKKTDLIKNINCKKEDIGKNKAEILCKFFRNINKNINIRYLKHKIKKNTDSTFNDNFYKKLNSITNTVKNFETKRYIKNISIIHNIPYLETYSNGLESDIQVIIPKITDVYREIEEYEDKIPLCILDNFPYKIEHTIIYSKNLFNKIFIDGQKIKKLYK